MQAAQYEILCLIGDWDALREVNILIDNFYQIIFSPDLEGNSPKDELVGQNS